MPSGIISELENEKYLCLETYRKNGYAVRTPVWFVLSSGLIYVITAESSWKVKRLKNNNSVSITPSDFKGHAKRQWMTGQAFFGDASEFELAMTLRNRKYGILARLIGMFVSRKGKLTVIKIKI